MYNLTASFHKGTCASSHLGHNRRTISVPHSDPSRKHLNVCYIDMSVEEAYHHLFDDALEQYNRGKKTSRQIKNYYEHIMEQYQKGQDELQKAISSGASKAEQRRIKSKYPKPYYEVIVSIANRDCYEGAFSSVGENAEITAEILNRYMAGFQERNPHLYVFSSFLHRDEPNGVNHIHCAYIPWTDLDGRGLPVRVSENGAFTQQGLTTGKLGDYGTVRFQEQERKVLAEIAIEYGIKIVDGKHSKKHLSKEEYILSQEQEKAKENVEHIEQEAGALLEEQDKFIEFLQNHDQGMSYVEHRENEDFRKKFTQQDKAIANAWEEFNQSTSQYFTHYRRQKALLKEELERARQNAYYSKKSLHNLLYDITCTNDFLITKLFKLIGAFFIALNNIYLEAEVQRLQSANNQLKQLAKEIMSDSQGVSAELKTKDIDRIEDALISYEIELKNSMDRINYITRSTQEISDR